MAVQKVIKVGNSLGVTLPKEFVVATGIKAGQEIYTKFDNDSRMVWISTKEENITGITPEFKKWLDEFTQKHGEALKELARR